GGGRNPKYDPDFWTRHFKAMCTTLAMATDAFKLKPGMVHKILVDDRHQILFGQMAKVASTNLGRIFAIMAGLFNSSDPDDIDPEQVHTIINHRETHLSEFPINDIIYRINTYYKFVFVRDPFERLLSAFIDKFSPPRPGYFEKIAKNIVRIYRKSSFHWKPIAFPEFIEYVSEAGRVIRTDNHWMPFHELSRPCELRYDFVGTIYTMHDDLQHVLRHSGLTGVVKIPEQKAARSLHETDKYLQQYYSQVPKKVLKKLYDVYHYDYELFNLTLPACIQTMLKL
ncbi:unnamed protein product, partial [Lymnaea stagnalis]